MTISDHQHLLTRIAFLADLTADELRDVASLLVEGRYPEGTVIFEEGSLGSVFYIITSGRVQVSKRVRGHEGEALVIGEITDFFGEMALLEHRPRSATVRAVADTSVLKISQPEFDALLRQSPRAYHQIAQALSSRLRDMNDHLIQFLQRKNEELQTAYDLLKETQSMLIASEKLATLGIVAGRIVHDIKQPTTCIMGHVELIRMQSPESSRLVNLIIREVHRLTDMVQEVMEAAPGKEPELAAGPQPVSDFVTDALSSVEPLVGERPIRLETDLGYRGLAVFDATKLRRVLYNLLSNALEALPPEGGTVRIESSARGRTLVLSVFDSGPGIPPQIASALFEPFVTAGKARGTGLGLTICRNIVEAHRGTIAVHQAPGAGTTFVVELPDCIP